MTENLQLLGIAGSLRCDSYNRGLLRAAQELTPDGVEIVIYPDLAQIPLYDADTEAQDPPPSVSNLKQQIRQADALLIATPEYNYGVPGVLKNAIDWVSRPPGANSPLYHKPIALMGASTGNFGTVRAQLALRQTFLFTRSFVLVEPEVAVFRAAERFDSRGTLIDESTRNFVRHLLEQLVNWTRQLKENSESQES